MVEGTSEEEFSVRDRRIRSAEPDSPPSEPKAESSPPPTVGSPRHEPPGAVASEPATGQEGPELASLFLMLASSALVHLGEAEDPVTGEIHRDLAQAKYTIDLLLLLREKTEGNRNPEESQLLEGILYDLQMRFVQDVNRR